MPRLVNCTDITRFAGSYLHVALYGSALGRSLASSINKFIVYLFNIWARVAFQVVPV